MSPNPSCASRNKSPVTKIVTKSRTAKKTTTVKKTRTTTVTFTNNATARRLAERDEELEARSFEEPEMEHLETADDEVASVAEPAHDLSARNLCPACPAGVVLAGKHNSGSNPVYCCPGEQ
jgi:hypothetical protein